MPKSFFDFGVPEDLVQVLTESNIVEPFPIQESTLTDSLDGKDVCGKAPTGSGKTLAFSIPMAARLSRSRPRLPRGLVLVPTRELAAQVDKVIAPLAKARGLRVTCVYGGVGIEPQMKVIRRGVDIVVACPGRLKDLIDRGALGLGDVEFVVVDEADRMADMGFLPDVRQLLNQTAKKRQTLLFSATLDGEVDVLIKNYQNDPVYHSVVTDEDEEDNRLHLFWTSPRNERVTLTAKILKRCGSTVIFSRTKHGAERLSRQLQGMGFTASAIHGGRTQSQREKALSAFSNGRVQVLVATDVAARGIHVNGVHCVINFDVPEDHKTYVHRSGRTARAGASGIVVSLVDSERLSDVVNMQRKLEMAAGVIAPNFAALPTVAPPRVAHVETPIVRDDQADVDAEDSDDAASGQRSSEADSPGDGQPTRRRRRRRNRRRPAA